MPSWAVTRLKFGGQVGSPETQAGAGAIVHRLMETL